MQAPWWRKRTIFPHQPERRNPMNGFEDIPKHDLKTMGPVWLVIVLNLGSL